MAQEDILGVKWNFYYESIFSMIQGLTNEDPFSDVTVVSGDELLDYQVHKFVLSAVSPVFKEILMNNPHEHPLIYLSDVRERELQFLLQLIYYGRTTVYDSQLDAFLKVLEDFQLREIELPIRRKTQHFPKNYRSLSPDKEHSESKKENNKEAARRKLRRRNNKKQSGEMVARINDLGRFACDECDASYPRRSDLKRHKETKHEGVRYECDRCDYKATQIVHLKTHQESTHERVRYECNRCDYTASYKSSLRRHRESVHEGVKYECDRCDYKATRVSYLKMHQKCT